MKSRILTGSIIFIVTMLLVFSKLLTPYIFDIFLISIGVFAILEMSKILNLMNKFHFKWISISILIINCAIMHLLLYLGYDLWLIFVVEFTIICLVVGIVALIKSVNMDIKSAIMFALNTALISIYPSFAINCIMLVNNLFSSSLSLILILLLFLIPMFTDSFALFVGILLKGKKLAPKISPKKTWSGFIGGVIGGVLASIICYFSVINIAYFDAIPKVFLNFWFYISIGVFCSILGQLGDLFESFLKRRANIKDSGNIFPGHGGMLDRIDNLLFVGFAITVMLLILI